MTCIAVILCTTVLFLAIILALAAKPKFVSKMTGFFIVAAAVSGLFIYSYGYAYSSESVLLAIVRSLLAVCGMFVAKMDFSVVSGTPLFQSVWAQLFFWVVHLFALYATASAAITTVGAEALTKLRLWLARWGELNLIYGVTDDSIAFGKALLAEKKCSVVYVDRAVSSATVNSLTKNGCAVRMDAQALNATPQFLKSIGLRPGSRKVTLYAIGRDESENLPYARALLKSMEERGIRPEQTSLVIPAKEEFTVGQLQVLGERYGYGYVTCYRGASLAARLLMREYPPCESISFDHEGKATDNFEALLVGFGQMGQEILKHLVMNSQFVGSKFRADVFAPDCPDTGGYFAHSYPALIENYDIHFHSSNAHSQQMYDFLSERGKSLNYVVICTGSDKMNREIAENFSVVLHRMGRRLPMYLCSYQGISAYTEDGVFTIPYALCQPQTMSTAKLDRMAMVLNHHYQPDDGKTPMEHWMSCDYFSRMSCRASTDFVPAFLRASGKSKEEALAGQWEFSDALLTNLGKMEHLRWNAFHFCMGFTPMTEEEFRERAAVYQEQKKSGKPSIRITKNMDGLTHACLIDWDSLVELAVREYEVTGKLVDYQLMDIKNVQAIPELLKMGEEA